jgi:shikimate kinase
MRGVSRTSAALTVVNALPTGVGCAVGIGRYVTVSAEVERAASLQVHCSPLGAGTPLVHESVRAALARYAGGQDWTVALDIRSEIPVAKGLKSSSAVSTATIRAVARAHGQEPTALEIARLAAEVGRSVGVSATGALDDALAGLGPGFVVTDNRDDTILLERPTDKDWTAVVLVPPGRHPPAPDLRGRFQGGAAEASAAVRAAMAGEFIEAMRLNTALVERLMGYAYDQLRNRLAKTGAVGAGVSGLGPALGAFAPIDRRSDVMGALSAEPGEHFVVDLTREAAP